MKITKQQELNGKILIICLAVAAITAAICTYGGYQSGYALGNSAGYANGYSVAAAIPHSDIFLKGWNAARAHPNETPETNEYNNQVVVCEFFPTSKTFDCTVVYP